MKLLAQVLSVSVVVVVATVARPQSAPPSPASRPTAHAVIITGLGGEKAYSRNVLDWSRRFHAVLTGKCGLKSANISVLAETADPKAKPARAKATIDTIRAAFKQAAGRVRPGDQFILFLAGLGQVNEEVGKLCLPGRDLRADDLEQMLDALPTRNIVIINAASGGAEFLKQYLKDGRVVLTGCGYETEGNQCYFGEFVIRAFETREADTLKGYGNGDGVIDMLEAYCYAAKWTCDWYHRQYRLGDYRPGGRRLAEDDPHIYWVVRGKETRKIWNRLYAGTLHRSVRPTFRPVRDKASGKMLTKDPLPANLDAEPDFDPKWGRFDRHWHFRRMLAETSRLDDNGLSKEAFFLWEPYKLKAHPEDPEPGETTWLARRTVLGRPQRIKKVRPLPK